MNEAVDFLVATPIQPLPPAESFPGAGVYLLYYTGNFLPYAPLARANRTNFSQPIYAGKAVPTGWRQARSASRISSTLYRRLNEHATRIRAAENLELEDFTCRFIILTGDESSAIAAIEATLIRRFQPLWNSAIDGFGNHDPPS